MKILKEEVKECSNEDGTKTMVLDIQYSHRKKKGRLLVKEYDEQYREVILKQLRGKVREYFLSKK